MSLLKKLLYGLVILLAVAVGALCTMDIGGTFIAQKGAQFIAQNYGLGVSIQEARGNPVRGYTFSGLELSRDGEGLIQIGSVTVDPALTKLILGNIALDWVELNQVHSSFAKLHSLGEIFSGRELPPLPEGLPQGDLVLNSLGGSLDGDQVQAALEVTIDGVPLKAQVEATVTPDLAVSLQEGILEVAGGSLSVTGSVMPSLNLALKVSSVQVGQLAPLVPAIAAQGLSGRANAGLTVTGELANPTLKGQLSFEEGHAAGLPISASASVAMENWRIQSDPMEISALGIPLRGSVVVNLGTQVPHLRLNFNAANVPAQTLRQNLPSLPQDLSGTVDSASVAIEGPLTALQGRASLSAAHMVLAGQAIDNTDFNASFTADGSVTLSGGSSIAGNPATLNGGVKLQGSDLVSDIALSLKGFDLASIPSLVPSVPEGLFGALDLALTVKGTLADPQLGGSLASSRLGFQDWTLENLSLPFQFAGRGLKIQQGKVQFMGAQLTAQGDLDFSETPKVDLAISAGGLDLAEVQRALALGVDSGLSGQLTVTAQATGDLMAPQIGLTASVPSLKASSYAAVKDLRAGTTLQLSLPMAMPSRLEGSLEAGALEAAGLTLTDLSARLSSDGQRLTIADGSASVGSGRLTASGTLDLADLAMNFQAALAGGDIQALLSGLNLGLPVSGQLNLQALVKGSPSAPEISLKADSPQAVIMGAVLQNVTAGLSGSDGNYSLDSAKANFGGGTLDLSGTAKMGSELTGTFKASANSVDLASAMAALPDAQSLNLSGSANLDLQGTFAGTRADGKGSLSVDSLGLMGFAFQNVKSSILLEGPALRFNDLTASFAGGSLSVPTSINLEKLTFSTKAEMAGADLAQIISMAAPGLSGGLSGTLTGSYAANGAFSPFKLSGNGTVNSAGGEVYGFPWVHLIAQLHGSERLGYGSAAVSFLTKTDQLELREGTAINARSGDRLYRALRAQGTIGYGGPLNLAVSGQVNAMIVNALMAAGVGGVQGLAGGAVLGSLTGGAALGGLLGGAIAGAGLAAQQDDFREISLTVGGTMDSPSVSNFKIGASTQQSSSKSQESNPKDLVQQLLQPDSQSSSDSSSSSASSSGRQSGGSLEDQLKQEVQNQLGNLLRRR